MDVTERMSAPDAGCGHARNDRSQVQIRVEFNQPSPGIPLEILQILAVTVPRLGGNGTRLVANVQVRSRGLGSEEARPLTLVANTG